MKLLLMSLLITLSTTGFAQQANFVLKANPIGLAFGNFNLTYEKPLDAKSSIGIGANYFFKLLGTDVSGFGVNGEYRFYITHAKKESPEGFYVGPSASFSYVSVNDDFSDFSTSTIGIGATVGYQFLWDNRIVLDLGLGPQYSIMIANNDGEAYDFSGFLPRLTIAVGYAFE